MARVELQDLRKSYAALEVLHGISVTIEDGEFLALVGPSGCGKSTLLRTIAGLESISSGEIRVDGKAINGLAPRDRDIAMVFQNYALYPHMSVAANMGFALKLAGMPAPEIDKRVNSAASILDLERYLARKPVALSGGQRQRVAMGRAIVRAPKVFLFDEPLSNLDAKLRVSMRAEIRDLQKRLNTTTVYVTHDQVEAMTMADKIVVLNGGKVEQIGHPLDLYRKPANLFVATFIGSPQMNLITGPLAEARAATAIGVRPEHLRVTGEGEGWEATVTAAEYLGSDTYLTVDVPKAGRLQVRTEGGVLLRPGDRTILVPVEEHVHRFDAQGRAL
ncbi:sugar ABC transporter ATP-binding protein [Xaviernesmea oryzae]|uniref:Sugar ABC transporter ATP-binding protein n=1 Tax=Xaviernesmea oryzae TaxID=464029 RepID=A0A1Q9AQU1_9HYPH|nr:sn-glycerol-3-phosphate ABC transporter ATP-binding protein UgpC [Xaviernesmea oryzae]OLP57751.1 sugar ABC transporter ATP-binding protein [Xaviernesmea oryzae]SEM06576.1 sorbitol ABC transporter ATP-binding protein/mannitol ABC transporter ATP-binding protein [Xaviernesmea oryzae]